MKRTATDRSSRTVPSVERVEVNENGKKKRIVLLIVAILVALGAFYYGISSLTNVEGGWQVIEATSASEMNCAQDFVFRYYLGNSGTSAAAENKALSMLYSQATADAYRIFNARENVENIHNLYYLNRHINQPVVVDEALYKAFARMEQTGSRYAYLGPAFQEYHSLFFCTEDWETEGFDPYQNEDQKAYLAQVADFARDPAHIQLELMENSTVRLNVSEAYRAFAEEYGIQDFVDFYLLQDAFIIDYLAEIIMEAGYTMGVLSSYDGYTRCLSEKQLSYENPVYDQIDAQYVVEAARVKYPGGTVMVQFHQMQLNPQKELYYYQFQNGETRTAYLDEQDALCKASLPFLTATARGKGCAEVAMQLMPLYASDALDQAALDGLTAEGIYPLYCDADTICVSDPEMTVEWTAQGYAMKR